MSSTKSSTRSPTDPIASSESDIKAGTSIWQAPQFIMDFYAKFPLVILEQEDHLTWSKSDNVKGKSKATASMQLWIDPPITETGFNHFRSWPSSSPVSLRTQLLFLLRQPAPIVSFRSWPNPASAPDGKLPALHLCDEGRLLGTDEIRGWLDDRYPMDKGGVDGLNGMPDQAAYDRALALAQVVLGKLYPAYLASLPVQPATFHLLFPTPPPLFAGLSTPLPASITGDKREIDFVSVVNSGISALEVLDVLVGSSNGWALGAKKPTPLDALIVAYLYPIYSLSSESLLRSKLESDDDRLGAYVERVLDIAERNLST